MATPSEWLGVKMGKCPGCGKWGQLNALSRRKGKGRICSQCGTREALEDYQKRFTPK